MLKYKIDVLKALKAAGYNTTRLKNEKQISQCTIQNIRNGKMIGINVLDQLCTLLDMQPGDIIEYQKEEIEMRKFEIVKNEAEYSFRNKDMIHTGCTFEEDFQNPETLEEYSTKEEAIEALEKYSSEIRKLSGGAGAFYHVTEYVVQENVYNEDGDWLSGGDIWKYAELPEVDF